MLRCAICGKESYVDGNAECSECARLRGYDNIELRRIVAKLHDANSHYHMDTEFYRTSEDEG